MYVYRKYIVCTFSVCMQKIQRLATTFIRKCLENADRKENPVAHCWAGFLLCKTIPELSLARNKGQHQILTH